MKTSDLVVWLTKCLPQKAQKFRKGRKSNFWGLLNSDLSFYAKTSDLEGYLRRLSIVTISKNLQRSDDQIVDFPTNRIRARKL